jgi:hypothetical protein
MRKRKLAPGEPVTFKIPVSTSPEQIELLSIWREQKILSSKIMGFVDAELNQKNTITIPISRPLKNDELERFSNPEIQKMLGNICLALLSQQVPQLPIAPTQLTDQPDEKQPVEWDKVDNLIDDILDDL